MIELLLSLISSNTDINSWTIKLKSEILRQILLYNLVLEIVNLIVNLAF